MKVTQKINLDFTKQGVTPRISVVQGDLYTRLLEITLTSNGEPWHIPEDVSALIRYRKPDRTSGVYDTLPDGARAYTIRANTITIAVAPDALTLAGDVSLVVSLVSGQQVLSTFEIILAVQSNHSSNRISAGAGCRIAGFLAAPENAKVGQILAVEKTNNSGTVEKVTAIDLPDISGPQGTSPTAKVEETATGAVITITDQNGTTTATVTNGADGYTPVKRVDYPEIVINQMVYPNRGVQIECHYDNPDGTSYMTGGFVRDGADGEPGKSAYEFAQDAGYTGTETEFAEMMAEGSKPLMVTITPTDENSGTASHTAEEIYAAYTAGRRVEALVPYYIYTINVPLFIALNDQELGYIAVFNVAGIGLDGVRVTAVQITVSAGGAYINQITSPNSDDIPTYLPNPSDLVISGEHYNGQFYVDMTDTINAMIDAKLGVIENGSY